MGVTRKKKQQKKKKKKNVRIITSGVREGNFIRVNIPSRTMEYLGEEPRTETRTTPPGHAGTAQ